MADLRQARTTTDGWLIFAAVIMFIVGFHNLIYGIAALGDYAVVVNNLDVNGETGVLYANLTFWGWLWIAVGIALMVIAFGIAAGNELARWVGIGVAAINAIGQLAFLAAFPVWSVVIIAIDILVIWALATYDTRARTRGTYQPYPGDRAQVGREEAEAGAGRVGSVSSRPGGTSGSAGGTGGTGGMTGSGGMPPRR